MRDYQSTKVYTQTHTQIPRHFVRTPHNKRITNNEKWKRDKSTPFVGSKF